MDSKQASQVTTGLVVVAVGLVLLAGQFDSGWALDFGRMWPLVFVVLGIGRLLTRDGRGNGVWFLFLGGVFLLHTYSILRLRHSWPLFIVLAGFAMMFPKRRSESGASKAFVKVNAGLDKGAYTSDDEPRRDRSVQS